MRASEFRRSAVAMMMVAGGLAAAVSYSPPVAAQASKGSPTAIPCNLTPKERRAQKKPAIPCDARKAAKESPTSKRGSLSNPMMSPRDHGTSKKRGADKLGDIK